MIEQYNVVFEKGMSTRYYPEVVRNYHLLNSRIKTNYPEAVLCHISGTWLIPQNSDKKKIQKVINGLQTLS